ncbi:hypothetical protein Q757_03710 [Oenococcus alcoholitolerans]|uniref:ABC transporter domain-containing protein n=1 Tax=Oenococcus alcoholitolerans TaxID=931074 RepID=A0ABR4XS56_9LACO|nr:hypothetical protein Q757_03710 [Oenococcus alcoholitolerans]
MGAFGLRRDIVFRQIKQLSAGQKVRAALVKVLLSDADLLVLDEPNNFFGYYCHLCS